MEKDLIDIKNKLQQLVDNYNCISDISIFVDDIDGTKHVELDVILKQKE